MAEIVQLAVSVKHLTFNVNEICVVAHLGKRTTLFYKCRRPSSYAIQKPSPLPPKFKPNPNVIPDSKRVTILSEPVTYLRALASVPTHLFEMF